MMTRGGLGYRSALAALVVIYVAVAKLGLMLGAVSGFATLVWAPSGIALAALVVGGFRLWPAIALGAFIVNRWVGAPLLVAMGIACGNTLEAVLGAMVLRRVPGFHRSLDRLADAVALVLPAALLSTAVSASIGVLSLCWGGTLAIPDARATWQAWWLGDMIGDLVVAPVLLTWNVAEGEHAHTPPRRGEAAALSLALVAAAVAVFRLDLALGTYALAPPLIWAALRFGQQAAARATLLVSAIAIWSTSLGHGPFVRSELSASLASLQGFMAITAPTFLLLGTVASERRRTEARFRAIFQESPIGKLLLDGRSHVVLANPRAAEIFGCPADELTGRSFETLVPRNGPAASPALGSPLPVDSAAHITGADRGRFALRDDGRRVPVEIGLSRIDGDEGPMVVAALIDVTERKDAEAEIAKAQHELVRKNRDMEEVVYTIAHDLKSPLVTIASFAGWVRQDAERRGLGDMVEIVNRIEAASMRLGRNLDDLLEFSRSGLVDDELEWVDIGAVVTTIVENHASQIAEKGAQIELDPGIPKLFGDRVRIAEVFANLVSNALRHGCGGDARIVRIGGHRNADRLEYFVEDQGAGIPPAWHDQAFRLFQQLDRKGEGTGVGLTIVKRVVETHAGTAWIESPPAGRATGTRVWLAFPVPPAEARP